MSDLKTLAAEVQQRVAPRGWTVRVAEGSIRARHGAWPPQMEVMVAPAAAEGRAGYGLIIDFRSMPFGGERFKDIFNADREQLLHLIGGFRVHQRKGDGSWLPVVSGSAFLGGFGISAGIARQTVACIFERSVSDQGRALVERFLTEVIRIEEAGSEIASTLQRVYQRTVLASTAAIGALYADAEEPGEEDGAPDAEPPKPPPAPPEPTYPWRR
jgi:hypothetical protein